MKDWEQLTDEPAAAYARFLIYRNLGPGRTLDAAYAANSPKARKGKKRQGIAPGQWTKESSDFEWRARATAWDIEQLQNIVPGAIVSVFGAIDEFALVTLRALQSGSMRPRTWAQLMSAMGVLIGFISPETAKHAMDQFRRTVEPGAEETDGGDKPV